MSGKAEIWTPIGKARIVSLSDDAMEITVKHPDGASRDWSVLECLADCDETENVDVDPFLESENQD